MVDALGVVFGDIGISPIYAFRESLKAADDATQEATVLGVLSLLFWALILVVAIKYVLFVMRADNHGEGGTMALLSLALPVAVGRFFAVAGLTHVLAHPQIIRAFDPRYAIAYVQHADGWVAFTVLGSVFLALPGGEALYADMGHF
jgi:K+ transporter